jgi:hypothetical protein
MNSPNETWFFGRKGMPVVLLTMRRWRIFLQPQHLLTSFQSLNASYMPFFPLLLMAASCSTRLLSTIEGRRCNKGVGRSNARVLLLHDDHVWQPVGFGIPNAFPLVGLNDRCRVAGKSGTRFKPGAAAKCGCTSTALPVRSQVAPRQPDQDTGSTY